MKKIAILQSNYIPWKGYFDLINMVDEFVLYDDVQYTRRDWRNRNKIKTPQGLKWLSIPVEVKGKYFQKINETLVSDKNWSVTHWKTIKQYYSKAPYYKDYKDLFEDFYMNNQETHLSLINARLIELVNSILGIQTKITWSSDYELMEGQTEKLLGICKQAGADVYLSGPAAKDYFDETLAEKMGIRVEWMDYSGYPEYQQLHPPFEQGVTILDLIFNEGSNAKHFMKSFK
ncbi:MAG: WbqC family protein [Vibrio sp.]|uniref:WbqC family protein n=1 Tax=Vibrio sp. TaxID=678 RepID=UPI003F34AB86